MKTESLRLPPFVRRDFCVFFSVQDETPGNGAFGGTICQKEIDGRTREEVVIVRQPAIISSGMRWWESGEVFGLGLMLPRRMCNHQKTRH